MLDRKWWTSSLPLNNSRDGLRGAGFDAVHVRRYGLASADDSVIFERATDEGRVVLSADTDFGTLRALRAETKPSVVLFRGATPRNPLAQVALLLANLPSIANDLENGAVAIIKPSRVRVRSLPFQSRS